MVLSTQAGPVPKTVHMFEDADSGLECVIAIHSTVLAPAAGGCRMWSYADHDAMAADACRLAEGMSYKNALAGLPLGGGKAVLQRPSDAARRPALFAAFGRAVRSLGGEYVTAEDVGTSVADMTVVARETRFVAGLPALPGAVGGDPSPWTARGVFLAMDHAVRVRLERDLSDCTVAIQGVGNVGSALACLLHDAGARLVIADVNAAAAARTAVAFGAEVASVDAILSCKADVFAPCALGGVLNDRTIGKLASRVVCGAANNQLRTAEDDARLADRNILYAPDFVVNAGGIINVAAEYLGWSPQAASARVEGTADRLAQVFALARDQDLSPQAAAEHLARQVIARGPADRRAAA